MTTIHFHDRYLDSEERYEIFTVKAAERPHLLQWTSPQNETSGADEEKKTDCCSDVELDTPPLTDGCDLPGWRCEGIAPCMKSSLSKKFITDADHPFQGTLNVGAGSTLFRRESLFPFMCSNVMVLNQLDDTEMRRLNATCWWYSAKEKYRNPPPSDRASPFVEFEDVSQMVYYNKWCSDESSQHHEERKVTLFSMEYEMKNRPVKILNATRGWTAMPDYEQNITNTHTSNNPESKETERWMDNGELSILFSGEGQNGWTFANLKSRFGNIMFRFSDQHGEMLSLDTYAKYITNPEGLSDDSPLGIYDSEFGEDEVTKVLLDEYSVPKCFSPDLFELANCDEFQSGSKNGDQSSNTIENENESGNEQESNNTRPPYRWILIGPERSGTGMHVDPLWTNAWVTVLQGLKRWLLFPPDTPHEMIGMHANKPQIPSSIWFREYYDKVTSSSWHECFKPVEVLQYPGETVFVPAGWPHIVLNLELTVAVTHNYASEFGPFEKMMEEVLRDEPEFATRWIVGLKRHTRDDLLGISK